MAKSFKERILEKLEKFKSTLKDKKLNEQRLQEGTDFANPKSLQEEAVWKPARATIGELQKGNVTESIRAARDVLLKRKRDIPRWADIADTAGVKNEGAKEMIDDYYTKLTSGPKTMGIKGSINRVSSRGAELARRASGSYGKVHAPGSLKDMGKAKNLGEALQKTGSKNIVASKPSLAGNVVEKYGPEKYGKVTLSEKTSKPGNVIIIEKDGSRKILKGATSQGSQDMTSAADALKLKEIAKLRRNR